MANREPMIVIKKITVNKAGAHGGSWKVAFADFMTAMMAFFLVMWLISQNEDVKKNVSDYFSTPSIIEYSLSNYGVELTLEKLFLDLINEPLKFFQAFIRPIDNTPNIMAMGSKNVVVFHMADQLGDVADNVQVHKDAIEFEIPAKVLFRAGTGDPSPKFVDVMQKITGITTGLENSNIYVDSNVQKQSVLGANRLMAQNVAEKRLDLISQKIEVNLEHSTVDIFGKINISEKPFTVKGEQVGGVIKFKIKQKDINGKKQRLLEEAFGEADNEMDVYQNFVNQVSQRKKKEAEKKSKKK